MSKFAIAERYSHITENLWYTYKVLADKYAKVNLGQGAPNYSPAAAVVSALQTVLSDEDSSPAASAAVHQYAPLAGHRELVAALAELYSRELGRDIRPQDGSVSVGVGAQGCIFNAINALVNPGDEVVIIEPHYDCYPSMVLTAGGVPVFVPLRPPTQAKSAELVEEADAWRLDPEELAWAFTSRTKLLVLNTPHNPLGKVFDEAELTELGRLCRQHDVVCLSDEVYEWAAFGDEGRRLRIAALPGMWDRTLTIGSAGKCFNVTGWRVGWCVGPKSLVDHVTTVQAEVIYSVSSPVQAAVARLFQAELSAAGLPSASEASCLAELRNRLRENRDFMIDGLTRLGLRCVRPSGGWFLLVGLQHLPRRPDGVDCADADEEDDVAIVKNLTRTFGLATIPVTPFFSPGHRHSVLGGAPGGGYLRVCINKTRRTLEAGLELLKEAVEAERIRQPE